MHPPTTFKRSRAGFTLPEILLAMLVFAIAISTILALLARSIEAVDEIVLKDEAMRLSSALEQHLQTMPFETVYSNIVSQEPQGIVFQAFHHRVGPDQTSPFPSVGAGDEMGTDYFIVPFVEDRDFDSTAQFQAREGRFFLVRLRVSEANPMGTSGLPASPDSYASAALVIFAQFYAVGTRAAVLPNDPNDTISVYSFNFAVRR